MRHYLEIYWPDSRSDLLQAYESDQPFGPIQVGDHIHPASVGELQSEVSGRLRVVDVEHILWGEDVPKHKVCVYTADVPWEGQPAAELSTLERFLIASHLRTHELLDPVEGPDLAVHREAFEKGYELNYSWLFERFWDGLTSAECTEVIDILDMYRAMTFSAQRLEQDIPKSLWYPFPGFDGNNETAQVGYARYFVHRLGRFTELAVHGEHTDFNSHMQSLPKYRAMLGVWKQELNKSHDLSMEQILGLLEARP